MSKLYHDELRKYLDDDVLFGEALSFYDSFHHPSLEHLRGEEKVATYTLLIESRENWMRDLIMDHEHPQCSDTQRIKIQAAVGKYFIDNAVKYLELYDDYMGNNTRH